MLRPLLFFEDTKNAGLSIFNSETKKLFLTFLLTVTEKN